MGSLKVFVSNSSKLSTTAFSLITSEEGDEVGPFVEVGPVEEVCPVEEVVGGASDDVVGGGDGGFSLLSVRPSESSSPKHVSASS